MGFTNYTLSEEQKRKLEKIADAFIHKIEDELFGSDTGGILDPYNPETQKIDNNKMTAMVWYIGEVIAYS